MTTKTMTPRERMLTALNRGVPDRLPVTIHQWQPYHLTKYMGGASDIEAFRQVGLDTAITIWDVNTEKTTAQWQVESHNGLPEEVADRPSIHRKEF
jgi:hypothetical protein